MASGIMAAETMSRGSGPSSAWSFFVTRRSFVVLASFASSRAVAAGRIGTLTEKPMDRIDAWRMIQRRAAGLGMKVRIGCHTFRAIGITAYLEAGGTSENAQAMATHESPRTTKLYDRTGDEVTLGEIEWITI